MNAWPKALLRALFAFTLGCGGNAGPGDLLISGDDALRDDPSPDDRTSNNPTSTDSPSDQGRVCSVNVSGSLTISTQAELDALAGCTAIEGGLSLLPTSGGLDLRPLSRLRRVGGYFSIGCNPYAGVEANCSDFFTAAVTSLSGLEALEQVGSLQLAQLDIATLEPLRGLRRAGSLSIAACPGLTDLKGLDRLEQLGQLEIVSNPNLRSLEGLALSSSLLSVVLQDNLALVDITALQSATRLQRLALNGVAVADLSALSALESLEDLSLSNTALRNFDGLRLRSVRRLYVLDNRQLEQVDAVGSLEAANDITFQDNPRLSRLPEFPKLTDELSTFEAFSFGVFFNAALEQGPSFPALKRNRSISITFQGNDALTSIDGLRALEVGGWVTVVENRNLRALDLTSLVQIDSLRVLCNPALSAEALASLRGVQAAELFLPDTSTETCPSM